MTKKNNKISFNEFLDGLGKEKELYEAMTKLSEMQEELIKAGDTDAALETLGKKSGLMTALDALEKHIGPWKTDWQKARQSLSKEDREKADSLLAQIESTLKVLLEKENSLQQSLTGSRTETVSDIIKTQKGRQAGKAYMPPKKEGGPRFFDQTQ